MIKTLDCADCRVEFSYDHRTGPTRQRCDTCTEVRRLATTRAKSARYRERWPERNREQQNRSNRKRLADPEHLRQKREDFLLRRYGLTPAALDDLITEQGNRCAVCRGERNGPGTRLHIDHCHDTGKVRGLLCGKCNTFIGLADDDPERLEAAAAYLRRC